MQLTQIGPRGYEKSIAQTNLSYTPLSDRAAKVTSVRITKPSATDTWNVITASKTVAQLRVDTLGNQQVTGAPSASYAKNRDFYMWAEHVIGKPVMYPVPNGQTFQVQSVGGATADVMIEFEECSSGDIQTSMMNHPEGKKFRMPIWAYTNANILAAGETAFDTQISPAFVPPLFIGKQIQAGYEATVYGIWAEGGGRNTFSGAADHQSITDHLYAQINNQRLFTRVPYVDGGGTSISLDGAPAVGTASAAGSANSVFGDDLERYPAFQRFITDNEPLISPGIHLGPGVTSTWGFGYTGSFTGGASYSSNYLLALCDVTVL
jgi:hypothetical protein